MGIWDLKSGVYQRCRRLPGIRRILEQEKRNLKSLLESVQQTPETVVDVGTGTGSTLDVFPKTARIVALDASFRMIRRCGKGNPISGVVGDARRLPFKRLSVRFLSVVGVMEYIPNHTDFLKEAMGVLSPGGCFLVTVSPKGFYSVLRAGLGHPLHPVRREEWEKCMERFPVVCLGRRRSMLQIQYLYQRKEV
jgi:ubiquinone/menaquinone biosynthesis C-methylase UbiE